MLNHLPVVVLVLMSMGLLADCYHTGTGPGPYPGPYPAVNCNTNNLIFRPLITGTQYQILYAAGYVVYRCAPPAVDTVSRWRWYCTTGQWIPSIPVCTPPAVVNGGWGAWIIGACNPPVCPDTAPMQTHTRLCNNPAPGLGGAYCPGGPAAATQIVACTTVATGPGTKCTNLGVSNQCNSNAASANANACKITAVSPTLVESMWINMETSTGTCVCDATFFHVGAFSIVAGGCRGKFNICYV